MSNPESTGNLDMTKTNVWIVFHGEDEEDSPCQMKIIGIFSSREAAEQAVDAVRVLPGFREWPELFHMDEYRIDETHWTSGFTRA